MAGLGDFRIHLTRSTASSTALMVSVPVDRILFCAAWGKVSSFLHIYLKPVTIGPPGTDLQGNLNSTEAQHVSENEVAHHNMLQDRDIFKK